MSDMKHLEIFVDFCIDCPYSKHMKGTIFMCMFAANCERLFCIEDGIPEWCELPDVEEVRDADAT